MEKQHATYNCNIDFPFNLNLRLAFTFNTNFFLNLQFLWKFLIKVFLTVCMPDVGRMNFLLQCISMSSKKYKFL